MQVEFYGAAREVTGSCHIVRVNGKTILLDCGLFQGRRADVQRKNEHIPLGVVHIDAIVLSHAHIDHAGWLPFLVRDGYRKAIHATLVTRDLCEMMFADAAHIQEKDAKFLSRRKKAHAEPLYIARDATRTIELIRGVSYGSAVEVVPGVKATFTDAGHILSSASVMLDCIEGGKLNRLVFSGDIGSAGLPIIRDPEPPSGANAVIMESTFGFMAENTLGKRIAEKRAVIKVYGEEVFLRAQVEEIQGYSAHAGRSEPDGWIDAVRRTSPSLRNVWLVHGEPDAQSTPSATLGTSGYRVHCPAPGMRADF